VLCKSHNVGSVPLNQADLLSVLVVGGKTTAVGRA
jgi:hypothetical protein